MEERGSSGFSPLSSALSLSRRRRTNAPSFFPLFHLHSQVDAAVGLATKLYSSSAKELSDQVSETGVSTGCSGARGGAAEASTTKRGEFESTGSK
jgi:hypothetical protein